MASKPTFKKRLVQSVPLVLTFESGENETTQLALRLAFDFNAFAAIEGKTGLNMLRGDLFRQLNATNLVVALWAAVQINQPEFGGDEGLGFLGSIVDLSNSADVGTAIKRAFMLSLAKEQREAIEKAEAEEEAAGKTADGGASPLEPTAATTA